LNPQVCYDLELERDRLSTRPHRDHAAGKGLTQLGIDLDMASELRDNRWGATRDPSLDPNVGGRLRTVAGIRTPCPAELNSI